MELIPIIAIIAVYTLIAVLLLILFRKSKKLKVLSAILAAAAIEAPLLIFMTLPFPPTKYTLPALKVIVPHLLITVLLMKFIGKSEKIAGLFITLAVLWGAIAGSFTGVLYYHIGPDPTGPFTYKPQFDDAEIVIEESSDISKEDVEDAIETVKAFVAEKDSYNYTIFTKFEYIDNEYRVSDSGEESITIYTDFNVGSRCPDETWNPEMHDWQYILSRDTSDGEWEVTNYGYG